MLSNEEICLALGKLAPRVAWTFWGENYPDNLDWQDSAIDPPKYEDLVDVANAAIVEKYFNDLRNKRNVLLEESDWTQVDDVPVDRAAWAEYRQALRDLPENTIDPRNPVWPTPPA